MAEPLITQKKPYVLELEPGEYWWCGCGLSRSQPFCDGSHEGTGLGPKPVQVTRREQVFLCGCRHSGAAPYCDGTHKKLE